MKKLAQRFPFGTWVQYSKRYYRKVQGNSWVHDEMEGPVVRGVVVGAKWKCGGRMEYDYDEGNIWESKGVKRIVLQVKRGYGNKIVEVIPESAQEIAPQELEPFNTANTSEVSRQRGRDDYRMHAALYPRDERGRFIESTEAK